MAKILIVDDSSVIRESLRGTLAGAGHEVLEAPDGSQALKLVMATTDIELLITDINMPNLDGFGLCRQIMNNLPAGRIAPSAIALTTESSIAMKQKGREVGIKGWINKPHDPERLLLAINMILEKRKTEG
jgi:two-component system chemotaxis response regulator CheY